MDYLLQARAMSLQILPEFLPNHISNTIYCTTGLAIAATTYSLLKSYRNTSLDHIPTVGSSTWLGSWWAAITYLFNAEKVLQEGYEKYGGNPFKVSTFYFWMVVVCNRKYVGEFNKSRNDELSFEEGVNMTTNAQDTLGDDIFFNQYHVRILRTNLNRHIDVLYGSMKEEIAVGFDELLDLKGHEWKAVPALDTVLKIIARTSSRLFVGLPLCRNSDYVDLNVRYTLDIALGGLTVGFFPKFMAQFVVRYLTGIPSTIRRTTKHLSPLIESRWKQVAESGGSWADCPNDFLSWLMQESNESQRSTDNIVKRVLGMGVGAIHNTSNNITQVLYYLAVNPQHVQPLREEVEGIIKEEGWSRASMAKMCKVDSFVKETLRLHGPLVNMVRASAKDVTFSDGTFLPKGTFVALAAQMMHLDDEYYENAREFNPWRFANMRSEEDVSRTKYRVSSTSPEYLVFGHGRHACPGRFFAAEELTTALAYVVVTYDIKLEGSTKLPRSSVMGSNVGANTSARLMFRKRVA